MKLTARVAIFIPSLSGGGAERSMVNIANEFAAMGIEVDLLLASATGPYLKDVSSKVNVIDFNGTRVVYCLPLLIRYILKHKPSAMLSALRHANVIAIFSKAISLSKMRLVISERTNFLSSNAFEEGLRPAITRFLMRYTYRYANAIIAISDDVARELSEGIGLRREIIKTIHNPINIDLVDLKGKESLDSAWVRDSAAPILISAGRMVASKGFKDLIQAFAIVHKKRKVRLIILGEGPLYDDLYKLAEDLDVSEDVLLPGFVDNPFSWMKRSTIFILSSHYEGFGNVLVRAMASGLKVISTDCPGGPRTILEGGRWGRLVPVSGPERLAQAIEDSLNDPYSPDVQERAKAFSAKRIALSYLDVLTPP